MSFIKYIRPHRKRWDLTVEDHQQRAYLLGLAIGLSSFLWIYLIGLALPAIKFVVGPDKPFKVFVSMIFGLATPYWLYLPYYLYCNYLNI